MSDLLEVADLSAGYESARILYDISFRMSDGQAMALLGRNGVGKTTLLTSLIGLTSYGGGCIRLSGQDVTRFTPEDRALAGIGWVPQERGIFRSLTVLENLTAVSRPGKWTSTSIFKMFPRLAERQNNLGHQLSGGEQQMLAIGRALVLNPKILLLDEPLEGLAPVIVQELLAAIRKIVLEEGIAAIIVEQNPRKILPMVDRFLILDRGRQVLSGASSELMDNPAAIDRYLSVSD